MRSGITVGVCLYLPRFPAKTLKLLAQRLPIHHIPTPFRIFLITE